MIDPGENISSLKRVGTVTARFLEKLGVEKISDLLFHFPFRYDDFSRKVKIAELKTGENANITGQIELIRGRRSFRRKLHITEALIRDQTGQLKAVWFNQPYVAKNLQTGDWVSLAGKAEESLGSAIMTSPLYKKIPAVIHSEAKKQKNYPPRQDGAKTGPLFERPLSAFEWGLLPVYHLSGKLTQGMLRLFIKQALDAAKKILEWLPEEIRRSEKLVSLPEALRLIHSPRRQEEIDRARRRLAFGELFLVQLESRLARREMELSLSYRLKFFSEETKDFVDGLPFKLTGAQRQAAWEILRDLEKERPMARMLTGDVGSGKTVVALIALLNTVWNGRQAVLMAPTEILARQHFETLNKLLQGRDIKIGLITSGEIKINYELPRKNQPAKNNGKILNSSLAICDSQIIIGTHALIQENIRFKNLALAVIDEQHRFGVEQRKALIEKSSSAGISQKFAPHFLSMTATPIPRSLALALFGDLDVSVLNESPAGRKKILTRAVPEEKREAAYGFIRKKISEGRQVFVICPLIDPSDKLGVKSASVEFKKLDREVFPDLKIGLLHGRMKPKEKEKVMREFSDNKIKILVSTSVVEVGVDIPNASVMMIEGADRFGLAQLHQFRGRVGRGRHESYCFLFCEEPSEKALARLSAMERLFDGFKLAELDLKMRGPGEVYGTAQKGFPELKIATLFDYELMRRAKAGAEKIVAADPSLNRWPLLKKELGDWERKVHLE